VKGQKRKELVLKNNLCVSASRLKTLDESHCDATEISSDFINRKAHSVEGQGEMGLANMCSQDSSGYEHYEL
jgi:hypothetical protein